MTVTSYAADATIDTNQSGSMDIYKYDLTRAAADKVWDASAYVSSGVYDDGVINALGSGYAIQGVVFTYLRIADICTYTSTSGDTRTNMVLYGMPMTVAKLNRIIRLSEASVEVCSRVDDGSLSVSLASAISFLRPANQDKLLDLMDINLKPTTEQVGRMRALDKTGKLTEQAMRDIIANKDIAPKKVEPVAPAAPAAPVTPKEPLPPNPTPAMGPAAASVPASPNVPAADKGEDDPFKGKQERPENLKIVLTGDRLRKYFPDVEMTPREVEESIYGALEERRQRQLRQQKKDEIFKGPHKVPSR